MRVKSGSAGGLQHRNPCLGLHAGSIVKLRLHFQEVGLPAEGLTGGRAVDTRRREPEVGTPRTKAAEQEVPSSVSARACAPLRFAPPAAWLLEFGRVQTVLPHTGLRDPTEMLRVPERRCEGG